MAETLGERIRKVRVRYGMSQAELARRIGLSSTSMNQIESGKTPDPAASRVKAIADVLRVSTDYLLGRNDEASERPWSPPAAVVEPATPTPPTPTTVPAPTPRRRPGQGTAKGKDPHHGERPGTRSGTGRP